MKITINKKKAILSGAAIVLLQMAIFYLLWMNPIVKEISAQVADHPSIKPYDFIGGVGNWMMIRFFFHIIFLSVCIYLYVQLYKSIPGTGWKKGMNFGFLVGLIEHVPAAFNQWTLIVYPAQLVLLQLVNGVLALTIFGTLVAVTFAKLDVIKDSTP